MEYASLREKIAAEKVERSSRYAKFEAVWDKAYRAGLEAGGACQPNAMGVVDAQSGQVWRVSEGPCGFAWVKVRRGNSSFAMWLKKTGKGRPSYYGGIEVSIREFGQSMERKEACARKIAEVLRAELPGVEAYGDSRMD